MISLATWNICLGLMNKKDLVLDELRKKDISVCCLQEVEITKDFPVINLTSRDYNIEVETNNVKSRTAIYIKTGIEYVRKKDIEESDLGVVVLDLDLGVKIRLVNLYRVFNPTNGMSPAEFFSNQIRIINKASLTRLNYKMILTGDFNLDDLKKYSLEYSNSNLFTVLNDSLDRLNLIQLVNFPTWERMIRGTIKNSILDHIYVNDFSLISDITGSKVTFGDHLLISFVIGNGRHEVRHEVRRSWQNYSKEWLLAGLAHVDFGDGFTSVQSCWNVFENSLVEIVDKICPLVPFINNSTVESIKPTPVIKNKINLRKRLLKRLKITKDQQTKNRISQINVEIKNHFYANKRNSVRRGLIPGDSKSLWDTVKRAKDLNCKKIPDRMTLENIPIDKSDLPDAFANFFKNKINDIVNQSSINPNVYNGTRKINARDVDFMNENDVLDAVYSLKLKNSEGYDRIPQRFLIDGITILIKPLKVLFNLIYHTKQIPEQWLVSKIVPVFKKGDAHKIENYRPIANLCSTSKIFEKLILKRLMQIQVQNDIDLTHKSQHGFKKKHSTNTAGLLLQSVLARSLDEGNIALMASLDLSSAFDVVNIRLLLKRMRLLGLPEDLVSLCGNWLSFRFFYVSCGGANSIFHTLEVGTVQGSILGPILYAIFVAPLFDLAKMTKFADDNYVIKSNKFLSQLLIDMKQTLEMITKWLKDSGLKVNDQKTELCLFSRNDTQSVTLNINNFEIKSKTTINVLGVIFDSKLQWQHQVENVIKKSNKARYAISIIKRYFNKSELYSLLTAYFYSILYYNADIWLIPSLKPRLFQQLLSASATAIKMISSCYDEHISFNQIHAINKRATPKMFMEYKHSLLLYKIYNDNFYAKDWLSLHFQQTFNARESNVKLIDTSRLKIGKNIMINRLRVVNGKICYDWLNLSFDTYKFKCKKLFL